MKKQYVVVGKWGFRSEVKMGAAVFLCNEKDGSLTLCGEYDSEIAVGYQHYDPKRQVLYVVDERNPVGKNGGGGQVVSYHFDAGTGEMQLLNRVSSLMSKPCYVTMDPGGEYVLVSCHGEMAFVNKLAFNGDKEPVNSVVYEDVGVVVFPVQEDGSLKPACDAYLQQGPSKSSRMVVGHPHCIVGSPDGEIYYCCDKGLDRIFSYKLDRQEGKLEPMASRKMPDDSAPRYGVFHPTLPVWYENNEMTPELSAYRYDSASGNLELIGEITMYEKEGVPPVPKQGRYTGPLANDLILHPNGKYLYASVSGKGWERIVKADIDPETGALTKTQTLSVNCGAPRGMGISPDGKYMLVACNDTGTVNTFLIGEDGNLKETGLSVNVPCAANIQFI